jgi:transcriptional regulator with XRE-family HTH domain
MLTPFGKFLRQKRLEHGGLLLKDVAEAIGISDTYLSAAEFGRRPAKLDWLPAIARALHLNADEKVQLEKLAQETQKNVKVMFNEKTAPLGKVVLAELAQRIDELSEKDLERIRQIILEGKHNAPWKRSHA